MITSTTDQQWLTTYAPADFRARPGYWLAKRLLETTISIAILLLLGPLWVVIAIAIKLTSPGPILYRAPVIGRYGRCFTYYKFRSMRANNDNSKHIHFIYHYVKQASAAADGQANPAEFGFKLLNDERVTPVGRLIRKLSLDEVPQLVNVIRGQMALVGPRPPVPYEFNLYDEWACQRLSVPPGITGLAQVRARGQASFQQMVELDLEYIRQRSLWLDLKIMLQTPLVMLKGA